MTDQPGNDQPSEETPDFQLGKPRPLEFQLINDDGQTAIYEALVVDCHTAGSPVLGLTVAVASSLQRESGTQVGAFLDKLQAAFAVRSEPPPDDGGPGDGGPGDGQPGNGGPDAGQPDDSHVRAVIGFRLASCTGPKPASIVLTVGTGDEPGPAGQTTIHKAMPHYLGAGRSDRFHSGSGGSFTAYVTAIIGTGTLSSPGKQSKRLLPHKTRSMTGKVVTVTADADAALTYDITGNG